MPTDYTRLSQQQIGTPIYNKAILANTNIYSSNLVPNKTPTIFEFWANMSATGHFIIIRSIGGTPVVTGEVPASAVVASISAPIAFEIKVASGETINIQYSAGATINELLVTELDGETG